MGGGEENRPRWLEWRRGTDGKMDEEGGGEGRVKEGTPSATATATHPPSAIFSFSMQFLEGLRHAFLCSSVKTCFRQCHNLTLPNRALQRRASKLRARRCHQAQGRGQMLGPGGHMASSNQLGWACSRLMNTLVLIFPQTTFTSVTSF